MSIYTTVPKVDVSLPNHITRFLPCGSVLGWFLEEHGIYELRVEDKAMVP